MDGGLRIKQAPRRAIDTVGSVWLLGTVGNERERFARKRRPSRDACFRTAIVPHY